jgi:cyclase
MDARQGVLHRRRSLMTAKKTVALSFLLLAVASFSAENSPELKKIGDGVYVRIVSPDDNAVGNAGVIVLDRSVLIYDTHFTPEAGREMLAQIKAITPKPIRYIVNSHFHPDHTHGNQAFPDAHFIGSTLTRRDVLNVDLASMNRTVGIAQKQLENLRREAAQNTIAVQRPDMRDQIKKREDYLQSVSRLKILPPFETLDESLTIQEGKQEVRLLWLGPGHTEGDVVLFLPHEKTAFLGDLFFNDAIPNVQDARMLEWIKTLREALKLDADKFIPGHGPIGIRKDVEAFLSYLEELKSMVEAAIDRGAGMEQATREIQVPEKYSSCRFQNFFPSNIQKMFTEIKPGKATLVPSEEKKTETEKTD